MNTMGMHTFRPLGLALLLLLGGCLFDQGGSDTETLSVSGQLVKRGFPQANGVVKLIPADYNPSQLQPNRIRTTHTDASGKFKFENLEKNVDYNLLAESRVGERQFAFSGNLRAGRTGEVLILEPARVYHISLHKSRYEDLDSGIAYFPGTDILARCNGIIPTLIDSVPVSLRHMVVSSRAGWKHEGLMTLDADTVNVEADSTGMWFLPEPGGAR